MADSDKIQHLQMIETIIGRMATNSFLLKGWTVSLTAATIALSDPESHPEFVFLAYLPVGLFWILDGYYLRQERLYRRLYDLVRDRATTDFSMETIGDKFEVVDNLGRVCWSGTVAWFHGVIVLAVLAVYGVLYIQHH